MKIYFAGAIRGGREDSALVAGSDQARVREYQTVADAQKIFQDFFS